MPESNDRLIIAQHVALVGLLIENAKECDPEFAQKAKERLDYVLGKGSVEARLPTKQMAEVRRMILETLNDPETITSNRELKKMTLKRRFLKWLQRE